MKISNEQIGFNKNHAMVISAVILAFAVYASPALGFDMKNIFTKKNNSKVQLDLITYDQVKGNVLADLGVEEDPAYNKTRDQLALLDRGAVDAQVLGEAIGVGSIPSAKDMILPEMEQKYPLKVINDNGVDAMLKYKKALSQIDSQYDTMTLMAIMNSGDQQAIKESLPQWSALLKTMSQVEVPSSVKEEYRARLGFNFSMMKAAEVYAGLISDSELPLYLKAIMAYSSKIETSLE